MQKFIKLIHTCCPTVTVQSKQLLYIGTRDMRFGFYLPSAQLNSTLPKTDQFQLNSTLPLATSARLGSVQFTGQKTSLRGPNDKK